jgi:catechol 2,3-dioxygenase-like lactoylglutathione lyase family enzyme
MSEPRQTPPHPPQLQQARLQLAINVSDLDSAIERYSAILGTAPHKVRDGYANFAVEQPPLKLVLFEGGEPGHINHLGVKVASTTDVVAETRRLGELGLDTRVEDGTVCCHALQDKVWVDAPDGIRWEVYTVLDDAPEQGEQIAELSVIGESSSRSDATCCT